MSDAELAEINDWIAGLGRSLVNTKEAHGALVLLGAHLTRGWLGGRLGKRVRRERLAEYEAIQAALRD